VEFTNLLSGITGFSQKTFGGDESGGRSA
jgi:hypothetical protein